jgi:hypothetical protein
MLTFPTLQSVPVYYGWAEVLHADPTFVTTAEQGCILSRTRATVFYKRWTVQYRGVTGADKLLVEAFQDAVGVGGAMFYYTCPTDATQYSVRLTGPIQFRLDPQHAQKWQIDFAIYGTLAFADVEDTGYFSEIAVLIPQQGAGTDYTDRPCFACPDVGSMKAVGLLFNGASAGVDDGNTAVVTIKDGAGATVVTKTYNTATQPPTDAYDLLDGSLTNAIAAGEVWTISVTQGASADLPELYVISTFYVSA